ncbi:hypothetical protein HN51_033044 [Arachis hypogaea]|uniref:Protein GLUTAMINE DUMPER n=2 Tax=Arachis TaxID=3817 RepID=A0A445B282_ARAHY|nr:protein GLUTAMINE DUMPER 5-like [Arachis duranensis]XP_025625685.1 protein GLUTAMINE DUMPER 5-like [Arachis hypogaea]QHO17466.1 Protein GLUTAMINE DUMPER [Arachis hypogaea]RYR32807.1 hypothetical protein Ahy_A10g047327 [Arachis hypogaea]
MDAAGGGATSLRNVSSPTPYLFGGLAFMFGLIAMALMLLACSYHNQQHSSSSTDNTSPAKTTGMEVEDSEPKIVVIMAGDSNPTYLAKPMSSSTCHTQESV